MDKYIFYTGEPAYHEPLGGKKKFVIEEIRYKQTKKSGKTLNY